MPECSKEDLFNAIAAVSDGASIRYAARQWEIPRTTLADRIAGKEPKKVAHQHLHKLSEVQEKHLAKWVATQSALGLAPTHS